MHRRKFCTNHICSHRHGDGGPIGNGDSHRGPIGNGNSHRGPIGNATSHVDDDVNSVNNFSPNNC